jgi:type 1 fimbria pilin
MMYGKFGALGALLLVSGYVHAGYTTVTNVEKQTVGYDLSAISIPDQPGGASAWKENNSLSVVYDCGANGSVTYSLNVAGVQIDNKTWKTSNEGVGIRYKLEGAYDFFPSVETYPYTTKQPSCKEGKETTTYVHVRYQLVRLAAHVPAGGVGPLPNVTVNVNNDDPAAKDFSQLFLSGIAKNIKVNGCAIDAPSQVTLPDLYTADLLAGVNLQTTRIPITLKNCPGAVNNITYKFSPANGTMSYANGEMKTAPGSARGIYLRLTKENGQPYSLNGIFAIDHYQGSGDYSLPANISYYIHSVNDVRPGPVNEAITLTVDYN